jgi:threonine synthase
MNFYSTRNHQIRVSFREALLLGQAPDGGLYMPERIPDLAFDAIGSYDFKDIALQVAEPYLDSEVDHASLVQIIDSCYSFSPRLHRLDDFTFCLELYHGPTFSFKDFGAQFMAKMMGYFIQKQTQPITILVATSGDTGSAVAHAYHHLDGIRVVLLYPAGKVSPLQEKQFTTLGGNICALKVDGTFDDCQALVKQAFSDAELKGTLSLTSANSINIGRLIPQSFYYCWAVLNVVLLHSHELLVCVPCGNFGNLTAGLFGLEMGLPVKKFIAAVNNNAVIPDYLECGVFHPRPSVATLSNAMDVGNPSNWERIRDLYNDSHARIKKILWSTSVNDPTTRDAIQTIYRTFDYIIDPHTAVGFEALRRFQKQEKWAQRYPAICLSTAHPAKFVEIVHDVLDIEIVLPATLKRLLLEEPISTAISKEFHDLKEYLWYSSAG